MTTADDYMKSQDDLTKTSNITAILLGIAFLSAIVLSLTLPDNVSWMALLPMVILGGIGTVRIYRSASVRNYAFQSWAHDAYGLDLKLSLSERLRGGQTTHIGDEIWVFIDGNDVRKPQLVKIETQTTV